MEPEINVDVNVSSSADDTAQNDRTAAMTSNAECEVPQTDQGMYTVGMCIESGLPNILLVFQ